jgi:ribosomal protein S18 acetylase RimI-like enzyme
VSGLRIRAARPTDAGAAGEILARCRAEAEWLPALYSGAEHLAHAGALIDRGWVTVAVRDGVIGFLARDGAEICALYRAPHTAGQGVGRALIGAAQAAHPHLWLRCHAANLRARAVYERAGFQATARGRSNDEALPDLVYEWRRAA